MCGIAGIINFNQQPVDPDELARVTHAMAHRGPDGFGFHESGAIGLGHRRLAIIDLEGGKQPVSNEDGSLWLVFNGEIYNFKELRRRLEGKGHHFKTRSDSEVIIHGYEQWGEDVVQHLRGMFAFAILDERRQDVFLARDRIGIKPLVYYRDHNRFAFASEIGALRALDDRVSEVDLEALDLYLHFQYIPAPYSIYRSIRKLPPAHTMMVSADGTVTTPRRYWDIHFQADESLTEAQWTARLDAALSDAVSTHLVSDVPFGAFLSGGVDSSAVTAYMSQHLDEPVQAFNMGYDEAACDETEYARTAACAVGARFHTEKIKPDALAVLPDLVRHYGEPFADSSAVSTWYVAQAARQHVKMVLSGDGGDETHAGYGYFAKMLLRYPGSDTAGTTLRQRIGALLRRAGLRTPAPGLEAAWYNRSPYFGEPLRRQLWKPEFHALLDHSRDWNDAQFTVVTGRNTLDQCQYVDIHNYLVYDNLNKVDIASMAHGLEVRVPLLDHRLLELVATIPPDLRVKPGSTPADGQGKYLLKQATQRFFPDGFYNRTKMGFSIPISPWLSGPAHAGVRERLLDGTGNFSSWFDAAFLEQLLDEHQSEKVDHGHRLWALLFLAEWCAQN